MDEERAAAQLLLGHRRRSDPGGAGPGEWNAADGVWGGVSGVQRMVGVGREWSAVGGLGSHEWSVAGGEGVSGPDERVGCDGWECEFGHCCTSAINARCTM